MTARPGRAAHAIAVLDTRVNGHAHQPARPGWDCRCCDEPWPCAPAKVRLGEAYAGDQQGLAVYMAGLYGAAVDELPGIPSGLLYARLVSWTRTLTHSRPAAPDGRQSKEQPDAARLRSPQPV